MVLSKEDFKKKIDTLEISDDKKIEILEDIEDSWTDDVNEEYRARYEAEKKEHISYWLIIIAPIIMTLAILILYYCFCR